MYISDQASFAVSCSFFHYLQMVLSFFFKVNGVRLIPWTDGPNLSAIMLKKKYHYHHVIISNFRCFIADLRKSFLNEIHRVCHSKEMNLALSKATFSSVFWTTQAHWKKVPVATFQQNNIIWFACCTFGDTFKYPESGVKTVSFETDQCKSGSFYYIGCCMYCCNSEIKCLVSGI